MIANVDEALLFVQEAMSNITDQAERRRLEALFIGRSGIGQISWLGICRDTNSSFPQDELEISRSKGVKGDRRSGLSTKSKTTSAPVRLLLPSGITTKNRKSILLASEEDGHFIARHSPELGFHIPGRQGENIRTIGLDLSQIPFGSLLLIFTPWDNPKDVRDRSPLTFVVSGSKGNALTLDVGSSAPGRNKLRVGYFIAAFMDEH